MVTIWQAVASAETQFPRPFTAILSNEVFRNSLIMQEEEEAAGIADEFLPCHI